MNERIVYGINTILTALERQPDRVVRVYVDVALGGGRAKRLRDALRAARVSVEQRSAEELTSLTGTRKHQGAAAALIDTGPLDDAQALELIDSIADPLVLVLDSVEDPRNFGACLRTADGAGVDIVVTGRSRGVAVTPVVSKVASGAAETQPLARVANLARFLAALRERHLRIVGADESGPVSLFDATLTGPLALVMGAEGRGLRRLTRERCDELVSLPMRGAVDSLNVAVATGICLYEAVRQRR
jgi:23S rRNA (guanosine2251-2'-O)-methyltransferase